MILSWLLELMLGIRVAGTRPVALINMFLVFFCVGGPRFVLELWRGSGCHVQDRSRETGSLE